MLLERMSAAATAAGLSSSNSSRGLQTQSADHSEAAAADDDRSSNQSSEPCSDMSEHGSVLSGSSSLSRVREVLSSSFASLAERRSPEMLDTALKSLYLAPDALERLCVLSAFGGEDGFFDDYHGNSDDDGRSDDNDDDGEEGKEESRPIRSGKFHRSASKTPASVVDGLLPGFFEQNFDPVVEIIREVASWGDGDVTERFMSKIEETDTDKDMVLTRLAAMVEANYSDLMECITHVQTIDVDLERAGLQITTSRRKISSASELIQSGPSRITALSKRRDQLVLVADLAKSLQMMSSIYQTMLSNIVTGDLGRAAECAFNVLDSVRNNFYDRFSAIDEISARMQRSVYVIRQKADRALMRVSCRKFAASEYANIIKAYLVLDHIAESLGVEIHDVPSPTSSKGGESPFVLLDSLGCLEGLAPRVMRFQLEDMDACLRTAVLEFIYASQHERQLQDRKLKGSSHSSHRVGGFGKDMLDLEEMELADLYPRVSPEMLVPCIIRSCELLIDVIHTHYQITQWHITPFDKRNNDSHHLHRCPIDLNDVLNTEAFDEGEEENDDEEEDEGLFFEEGISGDGKTFATSHQDAAMTEALKLPTISDLSSSISSSSDSQLPIPVSTGPRASESMGEADYVGGLSLESTTAPSISSPRSVNSSTWTPKGRSVFSSNSVKDETRSSIVRAFEDNFEQVHVTRSARSPKTDEDDARLKRLQGARLTIAYQSLAHSRTELWSELLTALISALGSIDISPSISLDDFLNMSWAITVMIKLGKEFCSSECKDLKSCLEKKTESYFASLHSDSLAVLRQMMDAETWDSVPINLGDFGGILGIIRKSIPKRTQGLARSDNLSVSLMGACLGISPRRLELATCPSEEDAAATSASSILTKFASSDGKGNPLHILLTNTKANALEFDDDYNEEEDEEEEEEEEDGHDGLLANTVVGGSEREDEDVGNTLSLRSKSDDSAETNFLTALLAEDTDVGEGATKRRDELNKAMVVTQSSLNGLARGAARYLQMMHLMPAISADILKCLSKLFDFYLCYVYVGFVSADDRSKFLAKHAKLTASPPDQSKDFEVLQEYLERSLAESSSFIKNIPCIDGADSAMVGSIRQEYHGLNARIVAAESCCFAAKILLELKPKFLQLLPERSTPFCEEYVSNFQIVASQLRSFVYRSMAPAILHAPQVLAQIEAGAWDSKKTRGGAVGAWVTMLVGACKNVRRFIQYAAPLLLGSISPLYFTPPYTIGLGIYVVKQCSCSSLVAYFRSKIDTSMRRGVA